MAPDIGTVAEFLIAVALVAAGLAVIGFPIKAFVLDGRDAPSPVPSLVVGLAVLQVTGWYWMRAGGDGMNTPTTALLACGAIGTVVAAVRRGLPRPRREQLPMWVAAGGAALLFWLVYASVFALPFPTTASLGNADAASYAVVAQHLVDHGFDDPGQVSDDLGRWAERDAFGSTALLGAASAVTGIGVWQLTTPLMFIFVVLMAVTLARLLNELFEDARVQSGLAVVAACAGFLFFFVVGQYFLGQVMAMAVAPLLGVAALRAGDVADLRSAARLAGSVAVVVAVFVSHYLHMLAPVLLLFGAAALAASGREIRSALPRIAGVLGAGTAAAVMLTPELVIQHVNRARELANVEAGFGLPVFAPSELVGALEGSVASAHRAADFVASLVLLGSFLAALIVLRRSRGRAARFAGATVALILFSYVLVYLNEPCSYRQWNEPCSYRQWKYISFFQPLFASVIFLSVCMAVTDLARARRLPGAVPVPCVALGVLAAAIFLVSGLVSTPALLSTAPLPMGRERFQYVDPALSDLAVNPKLAQETALNVNVGAFWDSMWAVYFLRDHQLSLQSESYYPRTRPTAAWTLSPREAAGAGPRVQVLNERFQLER